MQGSEQWGLGGTGMHIDQTGLCDIVSEGVRGRKRRKLLECSLVVHNYQILCVFGFRYSFVVAMGYLTMCHVSRVSIFHYGVLTTDFSG